MEQKETERGTYIQKEDRKSRKIILERQKTCRNKKREAQTDR